MKEWKRPQLPVPYPLVVVVSGGDKPNPSPYIFYGQFNEHPVVIGIGIKEKRFTYKLIKETGDFTVNFVSREMLKMVDRAGFVSGWRQEKSGLFSWRRSSVIKSHFIDGAPLAMEVKFLREIPFTDHILLLGEVVKIWVREEVDGRAFVLSSYSEAGYYRVGDLLERWGFSRREP